MEKDDKKPAPVATGCGPSKSVQPGCERWECNGRLEFRLEPEGESRVIAGREAETLRLLIRRGPRGFTSGEASPLGWARRTSHYVFRLRRKGVEVATIRERLGDARIGRYVLQSPVVLLCEAESRSGLPPVRLVPKSDRETIRIQIVKICGKSYLDVRILASIGEGETKPTSKGVTVPLASIAAFADAVTNLAQEVGPRGA